LPLIDWLVVTRDDKRMVSATLHTLSSTTTTRRLGGFITNTRRLARLHYICVHLLLLLYRIITPVAALAR
jgi:hypothetical protein